MMVVVVVSLSAVEERNYAEKAHYFVNMCGKGISLLVISDQHDANTPPIEREP
jgi:hypothetical protein